MKVIGCLFLSIFFFIAGCGDIKWFPGDNSGSPALTMAFSPTTAQIGDPVTLTFTITNSAENPAQSNLTFTDTLRNITNGNGQFPVVVANPPNFNSTCGGAIYTGGTTNAVSPGDQSFTFTGGSLVVGTATCTVSIDVTSNATTDSGQPFTNGPGDVTSNLNQNNLKAQSLAFTPFTNGDLSAKDLVVNTTNTEFSLFVINSGSSPVPATVKVEGFDAEIPPSSVFTAPIIINTVSPANGNKNGQQFTQAISGVPTEVKSWKITAIN